MAETPRRAAQYLRMSTEHQQYSTENQADVIAEYARTRGIDVVRTFTDAGKSGLDLRGRDGLRELLAVVRSGRADFTTILVYDVSRWGRFQDVDENAYYEFTCRQAGIAVEYCAEPFANDGGPVAAIVKTVKRAMAGEYSRELSAKVFKGQCKLVTLGFRQGGPAGYGLRRMRVDASGAHLGELARGQQKSLQTDRVVLVPGPPAEVATVRRIYAMFIAGRTERQIADALTGEGLRAEADHPWTCGAVHRVLTNEKYIGHNVYNRVSYKLKKQRVRNPPELWVRCNGAFAPIVDAETFFTVRGLILARHRRLSDDDLLARLAALRAQHGHVSGVLIDETEGMPSSAAYRHRFGSLARAYRLIGYAPGRDDAFIEINRRLRALHRDLVADVAAAIERAGGRVARDAATDLLALNGRVTIAVVLARHEALPTGASRWTVRLDRALAPDLTIAVRMDSTNRAALDYYVLPALDLPSARLRLAEDNALDLDAFRFETLDAFLALVRESRVEVAA